MSLHANVSESCNTICNRLAVRSPKQGLESRRQAQCNCLAKSVVLRDVHRQCRYIISVAYTERCTAFVHANSRPISTRAANQQDYRVRVQKNLVVCAPALNSMRVSTRARARTHRCETHYCVCVCVCGYVGVGVCVFQSLILFRSWSRDECRASLRPRLAHPLYLFSCRFTRYRAFHVEPDSSRPLHVPWRERWWGKLGHVGGVRPSHAQSRCPFTSPARSSNVFRRGL